ncbi:unnamed protein product, partial [Prorocentrum cordatum]
VHRAGACGAGRLRHRVCRAGRVDPGAHRYQEDRECFRAHHVHEADAAGAADPAAPPPREPDRRE